MLSPLNSIGWLPLPSSTILSFFDLVTTCILRYPSLLVYFWILFVKSVLFSSPAWISSPWGFKLTLLPSEDKQVKYHHLKLLWVPVFHCFPFFFGNTTYNWPFPFLLLCNRSGFWLSKNLSQLQHQFRTPTYQFLLVCICAMNRFTDYSIGSSQVFEADLCDMQSLLA